MEHMSAAADGNLGKLLRSDVAPERGALIDLLPPRRAWTCGELDAAADAFADALTREASRRMRASRYSPRTAPST